MIGQSVGSDASRLSCFLFRPRKRFEKRRKRSHTNVSNASVIRTSRIFQVPLQAPLPCFHQWVKLVLAQSSAKRPTFAFMCESGYTLAFRRRIAHKGSHAETGRFPPPATARSCAASEIATERTAGGSGCTPMACVRFLRRRGPAGLRDLFRFCRNCGLYILRSGLSACARQGWYHYPRCALRVVEMPDGRLSKGLICRFLRSGGHH